MSYKVYWDDETHKVIVIERSTEWQWLDFDRSIDDAHVLAKTVPYDISMIVLATMYTPPGNAMKHYQRSFKLKPANITTVIIIRDEYEPFSFIAQIFQILIKLRPGMSNQMRYVKSLDEARAVAYAGSKVSALKPNIFDL